MGKSYDVIGEISAKDVQNKFKLTEKCYLDKYQGDNEQKSWQDYLIEDKNFHRDLPPREVWALRQGLEKADYRDLKAAGHIPLKEALDLSGYPILIASGIKQRLYQGYKLPVTIFEELCVVEQSTKREERYGGLFETSLPEEVLPGDKYPEQDLGEKVVFIGNRKYGSTLALDMELVWHDQQNEILRKAQSMGRGVRLFQEKTVINTIVDPGDNGFRTSSSPTGVALYDASVHKNLLTTALSATQMETAIQAMRNFKDDKGNPMLNIPDTFLGPLELEGTANRIMKAQGKTGDATTTFDQYNYLKEQFGGGWKTLTSPFFSSSTPPTGSATSTWYLMNRSMGSLVYQEVLPLTVLEERNDSVTMFERDVKRFKVMIYFGVGFIDFRSVLANRA